MCLPFSLFIFSKFVHLGKWHIKRLVVCETKFVFRNKYIILTYSAIKKIPCIFEGASKYDFVYGVVYYQG